MREKKSIFSRVGFLAGTAAFILAFTLSGCISDNRETASRMNRSDTAVSQSDGPDGEPSFNIHEEYEWECQIHTQLPVYRFVLDRDVEENLSICPSTLSVYDKQSGELLQTLSFDAVVNDVSENPIPSVKMTDVDFDGYLDLIVHAGQGAGTLGYYEVYCWQANGTTGFQGYSSQPSLDYSNWDYQDKVFSDTHQFTTSFHELGDGTETLYQVERADSYSRPEFRMLRYCYYDYETDDFFRVMELTDNGIKCIYKVKYSSLNEKQNALIENYLRFGVPNPVTSEQALQIASEIYPDAELQLVQMLTFGGKSYYHVSWSNGSESGDCGISTDGKESVDCKPYLEELRARAVPAFNRTGDTV